MLSHSRKPPRIFTVTFTDGDATTYNGGFIKLYVSWAESDNIPGDPTDVIGTTDIINNGSASITLNSSQISTTNGGLPQGDNFDKTAKSLILFAISTYSNPIQP